MIVKGKTNKILPIKRENGSKISIVDYKLPNSVIQKAFELNYKVQTTTVHMNKNILISSKPSSPQGLNFS